MKVRALLREQGFSGTGSAFRRRSEVGNTLVLSFQRSTKSSRAETLVTLNYGVYSERLAARLRNEASPPIDVTRVHWRRRLEERGEEKWISVKSTDSVDTAARSLLDAVNDVLPTLVEHGSDEALRDEWMSGAAPGRTGMERLLFLAILLNEIGPAEELAAVLEELRRLVAGGVHEGLTKLRLERAGIRAT